MRNFLLGLVIGGALVAAAVHLGGPSGERPEPAAPPPRLDRGEVPAEPPPSAARIDRSEEPGEATTPPATLAPRPPPSDPVPKDAQEAPMPDRGIVLGPGQGAVLATGEVLERGDLARADVICEDVGAGWGGVLACPHGGAYAQLAPRKRIRLLDLVDLVDRCDVGPADLDEDRLRVLTSPGNTAGFGFVRDGGGIVWKVWAVLATTEPDVLSRRLHVRRLQVPVADDGGAVSLPQVRARDGRPQDLARVEQMVEDIRRLPSVFPTQGHPLLEPFLVFQDLPAAVGVDGHTRVLVELPLTSRIETNAHDGVIAARGISSSGRVDLDHHSACLVEGDVDGEVDVDDHALLIVDGDLLGTVVVGFHASLRLEGDLHGRLVVKSHARVLLLGQIVGSLTFQEANHTHLYLALPLRRSEIAQLPGPGLDSHCTLHLPASDLEPGEHENVGRWPKVVVGESILHETLR